MSLISELRRRNVIRVALGYVAGAWLLIQVVETLFPVFGLGDGAIRVVVIALAIGFLPALVLAWAFQWSPGGLVRDDGTAAATPAAPKRAFDRIVMAILALAVAMFAVHTFIIDPARDAEDIERAAAVARTGAFRDSFGDKSIAVLPFENLSSDPEQEFMADGLAEELLNLLASVPELRVTSRTSAFQFKESSASIPDIADTLGVSYILEGSVRRSPDRIRITAQLIDARADAHLWSETYDRPLADIFAIQDEVAAQVTEQLKLKLQVGLPRAERHDTQAYTLYLQARHLYETGSGERYLRAAELLDQVLALDPDFIEARVWQIWAYDAFSGETAVNREQKDWANSRALETLDQVAVQAPDHAAVNGALAWFRGIQEGDLEAAARYTEFGLQADARDRTSLVMAANLLLGESRLDEARRIAEWITRVDPLVFWPRQFLAEILAQQGEMQRALVEFRVAADIRPDDPAAHWKLGLAMLRNGEPEAALAQFERAAGDPNYYHMGRSAALHDLGRFEESDAEVEKIEANIQELQAEYPGFAWDTGFARLYAWRGEIERVIEMVSAMNADPGGGAYELIQDPLFDRIENDPRWVEWVEDNIEPPPPLRFEPNLPPEILVMD